jgi:hypothetical protein
MPPQHDFILLSVVQPHVERVLVPTEPLNRGQNHTVAGKDGPTSGVRLERAGHQVSARVWGCGREPVTAWSFWPGA